MSVPARVANKLLGGLGAAAGTGFDLVGAVRRNRPLHPDGALLLGSLTRTGHSNGCGIRWVDEPGVDSVIVRVSRSVGLPTPLPDVLGVALRCHAGDQPVDLLMATTGLGTYSRWVFTPRTELTGATVSTVMPLRGSRGPVLLAGAISAERVLAADLHGLGATTPTHPLTLTLLHATPRGPWTPFAHAELHSPGPDPAPTDTAVRFDPVSNPPPGSTTYEWTRRLREPSYAAARHHPPRST